MQVYDDLIFTGNPNALNTLWERVNVPNGEGTWVRDEQAEEALNQTAPGLILSCFKPKSIEALPVRLWLRRKPDVWEVSNIVPQASGSLTPDEYHARLVSFREFVLAAAGSLPIKASEPTEDQAPAAILSHSGYKLLHTFSTLANKSTGVAHPRDLERWNAFLIELHRQQKKVDASELKRILVEHERWPEHRADELAILFENEQSLLSDFAKSA